MIWPILIALGLSTLALWMQIKLLQEVLIETLEILKILDKRTGGQL